MTLKELKYLDRLMEGMEAEQVATIAGSLHLELALAALRYGILLDDRDVTKCIAAQRIAQPRATVELFEEIVQIKL